MLTGVVPPFSADKLTRPLRPCKSPYLLNLLSSMRSYIVPGDKLISESKDRIEASSFEVFLSIPSPAI